MVLAGLSSSASADAGVPLPSHDGFYRYTGRTPLSRIAPGTPLKQRTVTLGAMTSSTPLEAQQILYRTTDAAGSPTISVTTVVLPVTGTVAPRVVAYLSFYDALGAQCDPSYTLRGGDPGAPNAGTAEAEQAVVHTLHQNGYVVTVPDFENVGLDYVAGTESGMSTLDGIRATLAVLTLDRATPVGLMGYSGGSIAADWASELAPRYAPQVNLVGTAMGGVPVHLGHILTYIDGSPTWSSVMPAAMLGIARGFHVDLAPYLSEYGKKVVRAESTQCIGQFSGAYPGLTLKQLFKPQYADVLRVPALKRLINALIMGSAPGHPTTPMLVVAGNLDGTGDGVMVAADQEALAHQYCQQGVPVVYEEVQQGEHTQTGVAFMPQALAFLADRFSGAPPVDGCALIGPGSSLAPIR